MYSSIVYSTKTIGDYYKNKSAPNQVSSCLPSVWWYTTPTCNVMVIALLRKSSSFCWNRGFTALFCKACNCDQSYEYEGTRTLLIIYLQTEVLWYVIYVAKEKYKSCKSKKELRRYVKLWQCFRICTCAAQILSLRVVKIFAMVECDVIVKSKHTQFKKANKVVWL